MRALMRAPLGRGVGETVARMARSGIRHRLRVSYSPGLRDDRQELRRPVADRSIPDRCSRSKATAGSFSRFHASRRFAASSLAMRLPPRNRTHSRRASMNDPWHQDRPYWWQTLEQPSSNGGLLENFANRNQRGGGLLGNLGSRSEGSGGLLGNLFTRSDATPLSDPGFERTRQLPWNWWKLPGPLAPSATISSAPQPDGASLWHSPIGADNASPAIAALPTQQPWTESVHRESRSTGWDCRLRRRTGHKRKLRPRSATTARR
jgi:hypothetical protein